MNKPKLNDPDVEITTTTTGESITINKTIPSKQFKDIFVTGTSVEEYIPTLEKVKKEWEELGYEWIDKNDDLINIKHKKDVAKDILIYTSSKNYISIWTISFQEHQLLTKTFRALGWFE